VLPTERIAHLIHGRRLLLRCGISIQPMSQMVNTSRHGGALARPLYLQQRTYLVTAAMAVECHLLTNAPQQKPSPFNPGTG